MTKDTGRENTSQKKDEHENLEEKRVWTGVFEDVTYSSGPGDNIFVYG